MPKISKEKLVVTPAVAEVSENIYILTLTSDEAYLLKDVVGSIVGSSTKSRRGLSDSIFAALDNVLDPLISRRKDFEGVIKFHDR